MEKRKKRGRGPNWNHAHTLALAELKREASLNKEGGGLVWERIAQTLSSRYPGQMRTGKQCRRRWDILVKVYNHIENYCVETGVQGHRELDKGELASMKLDTAYQQDWYDIVEQVCSQRNAASTSKPGTYHGQSIPESTRTCAQVISSSTLEVDKLSPKEEVQHGQVSHEVSQEPQTLESAYLLPQTFPAENGVQQGELTQEELWALLHDPPLEPLHEIELPETESELLESFFWESGLESDGLGAQTEEPLEDHVCDDWFTVVAQSGRVCDDLLTAVAQGGGVPKFDYPPLRGGSIQPAYSTKTNPSDSTNSPPSQLWSPEKLFKQAQNAKAKVERNLVLSVADLVAELVAKLREL